MAADHEPLRSYDPVVRVGGAEFICALSDGVLESIQQEFSAPQGGPSMTFGLAALHPDDSLAALTHRADEALLEAKAAA